MLVPALVSLAFWCAQPVDQKAKPGVQTPAKSDARPVVSKMTQDAELLRTLVKSEAAKAFLAAVPTLPEPVAVTIYRDREKGVAVTAAEWAALPKESRDSFKPRECSPEFYYTTGFGSPLVYVRVIDIVAGLEPAWSKPRGRRVLDFGYGSIGQLRLLTLMGAGAAGVDVEPLLAALYRENTTPRAGEPMVFHGRWPAEPELVTGVSRAGPYDLITSKNTLKAGYVHPSPPKGKAVDERQLVKLGVSDEVYLKAVRDALTPGGLFVIYNICPAQSPAEDLSKPYIPWADGKCPFTREQFAGAGLDVVAFDVEDHSWALDCWGLLGYNGDKSREDQSKDLYVWYTVARRPHGAAAPERITP